MLHLLLMGAAYGLERPSCVTYVTAPASFTQFDHHASRYRHQYRDRLCYQGDRADQHRCPGSPERSRSAGRGRTGKNRQFERQGHRRGGGSDQGDRSQRHIDRRSRGGGIQRVEVFGNSSSNYGVAGVTTSGNGVYGQAEALWAGCQPVVQDWSFSGLRTAHMRLIWFPVISKAITATVTPSCCVIRPGWPPFG